MMNEDSKLQRLTSQQVLQRYKDQDVPSFCDRELTDVNQVGLFGERPLGVAAVRGDTEEIRALIDGGADVNAAGEAGNTPLHEAVIQGHLSAAKLLLESGASLDVRNEFGQTVLDLAESFNYEEIVALLRKNRPANGKQ